MTEPIIKIENLGKKYILRHKEKYITLRDSLNNLIPNLLSKNNREEFWALKDINVSLYDGDVLGIIGKNGSGKSTLLKIMSRITYPSQGQLTIKGNVASLLEVGTGFNPELTGRENIYLNGAILGMKSIEIRKNFDEIVNFSGVEKFLDTPVKHYSSGMYVRLAFSIAAHLSSDVLLVDEVLAVGDAEFQKRCLRKMGQVAKSGRTVLFVSHNMQSISDLCNRVILLSEGKLIGDGKPQDIISQYIDKIRNVADKENNINTEGRKGTGLVKIDKVEFDNLISGEEARIKMYYSSAKRNDKLINCRVAFAVKDLKYNLCFICSTEMYFEDNLQLNPTGILECTINKLPLGEGEYVVDLFFEENNVVVDWLEDSMIINVSAGKFHPGVRQVPKGHEGKAGTLVEHKWSTL